MSECRRFCSAATSLWTVLVAGQEPCVTFWSLFSSVCHTWEFSQSWHPRQCTGLLTSCYSWMLWGPVSSLPVVLVCGETETWNRDLQGLLSLLWKKWCLTTSWCQRAMQASKWTSSEDIPFNPACLFLPCSRESPHRGFGPAVLPTRLLSRLTYHR